MLYQHLLGFKVHKIYVLLQRERNKSAHHDSERNLLRGAKIFFLKSNLLIKVQRRIK